MPEIPPVLTLTCTPASLLPHLPCLVCGRSQQDLLRAFDALLCAVLNQSDCTAATLREHARPYLDFSHRELIAVSTYLWLALLVTEAPETDTDQEAMAAAVSPFLTAAQLEILAMQLWLLCQMTQRDCDPDDLINAGRCYCVSTNELLAIRIYLLGVFVNNFSVVDMDPDALKAHALAVLGTFSVSALEAATVWAMCQVYNTALLNPD